MARRADPVTVIWAEAPAALSFLAEDWGFSGPELTADGVAYHRLGLHVAMRYWTWKNERGFTTTLAQAGTDGAERRAELGAYMRPPDLARPAPPPRALARCMSSASAAAAFARLSALSMIVKSASRRNRSAFWTNMRCVCRGDHPGRPSPLRT